MARLFGLVGNRADLAPRVLAFEREALRVHADTTPLGWGIGFYQSGEVLMKRRPIDDHETIDVAHNAADVRGDVVLGHVRVASVGAMRTENTHPFRYRQWMFAQTGTLPAFADARERLLSSIPEFLRSGIRGDTDAEVTFHIFLSFLHDHNQLSDGKPVEPSYVREALRSTLALVDGMAAEFGAEPARLNIGVTDGEYMVLSHRGQRMGYRVFAGKNDAEMIMGEDRDLRRRTPELSQMHSVLVASDFDGEGPFAKDNLAREISPTVDPLWKSVPEYAIVTVSRGNSPEIEPLS
jgi:glutamine amidotransferase